MPNENNTSNEPGHGPWWESEFGIFIGIGLFVMLCLTGMGSCMLLTGIGEAARQEALHKP